MPKILSGIVVDKKLAKTVTVTVVSFKSHRLYKKQLRVSKKFLAHDPDNSLSVGEAVNLYQSRPISKRKNWLAKRK